MRVMYVKTQACFYKSKKVVSGHWATPRLRLFSILTLPNSRFKLNNRSNEEGSLFVSCFGSPYLRWDSLTLRHWRLLALQ